MQVKRELIATHTLNMDNGNGRQRTYGALMDGIHMILLCFDAGEGHKDWKKRDFKKLRGTFTHSRCAVCIRTRGKAQA